MNAETHLDAEWSPASGDPITEPSFTGRLVSLSIPAPDLSWTSFLNQAEGQPRFFWQKGNEDKLYAGFGTAVQLMAWGENRFEDIGQQAVRLFGNANILGEHAAPILPRLFGGFSFRDDFTPDNTWAIFYPAHFVLPHYQLVRKGAESWLTINTLIADMERDTDIEPQLHQALQARYEYLRNQESSNGKPEPTNEFELRYPMSSRNWADLINRAQNEMSTAALRKVVLARVCEIRSHGRIDVCQALNYLKKNYGGCTRFLFEPRPFHAFYGATPEILVNLSGRRVSTMALAGSKPRGTTAEADQALTRELLTSEKERHEHRLVIEAIRNRLEPLTEWLNVPTEPVAYKLSYIQHLLTPISGELRDASGILPLVQLLHPTPAMGGSPRDIALDFIGRYEPVPRGWYAAPVGWLDSEMNGEFVVAIRSAVAQERRVWCYAGAGIVPGSEADNEWTETELKFRPMLRALGVR